MPQRLTVCHFLPSCETAHANSDPLWLPSRPYQGILMADLDSRIAGLNAEQRRAFEKRLRERGLKLPVQEIVRRSDNAYCPLSSSQERIWIDDARSPGTAKYNESRIFHLNGLLDRCALESSLSEVLRRHEVLRSRIETRD